MFSLILVIWIDQLCHRVGLCLTGSISLGVDQVEAAISRVTKTRPGHDHLIEDGVTGHQLADSEDEEVGFTTKLFRSVNCGTYVISSLPFQCSQFVISRQQ